MRSARVFVVLTLLAGCTSLNAKTMSYGTMAEARAAGAIDKGWVPAGLPDSVFELRVAYVPGGFERWGLINFPASAADAIRGLLKPEEFPIKGVRCEIPPRIEWWPVLMRGEIDGDRLAATGARAYQSRDGKMIVVVNWTQGRAYYWTTG